MTKIKQPSCRVTNLGGFFLLLLLESFGFSMRMDATSPQFRQKVKSLGLLVKDTLLCLIGI